jgi:hypothetical protein
VFAENVPRTFYIMGAWCASVTVSLNDVYKHVFRKEAPRIDRTVDLTDVQDQLRATADGEDFTLTTHGIVRTYLRLSNTLGVAYRMDSPERVRMLVFEVAVCHV